MRIRLESTGSSGGGLLRLALVAEDRLELQQAFEVEGVPAPAPNCPRSFFPGR
jgi:hypothetical protein